MATTNALLTLEQVVSRFLFKYKRPLEDALLYTEHAADCVKDYQLYHGNDVTVAKVSISNYLIEMPASMIGFVDLCWYFGGRYWSFTEQKDIVRTTTFTGAVEGRDADYEEGQPINHGTSYTYGSKGGVNTYNYTIDWGARRIFVDGVNDDTAILFYTGSGIEVGSSTYVNDLITPLIDTYLLWKESYWIPEFARERKLREGDYTKEMLKIRNFNNALSYNQLRDILLGSYTQGPKR